MSAHPLVPGPTLEEYCQWLIDNGGSVQDGKNEWGGFKRLISPDGERRVMAPETDQEEALLPLVTIHLDDRLGLTSPWNPNFYGPDGKPLTMQAPDQPSDAPHI